MKVVRRIFSFLLLCGSAGCIAQSINSGDIRGTVTDSSGALIPGVTVTVLNISTAVSKTFTTNQDGLYDTSSIVAGSYEITFSKDGFNKLVRGPITLEVGYTTVNAQLQVGAVTQQVVVNSDIPLLKTEEGDQTATLEAKTMSQLPQIGQDWESFMILLPGTSGSGQYVSANGNLPYSNVLMDGSTTIVGHSMNSNAGTFETVSELQVSLSSFSAQYGIGGMIMNQITKGGTAQFHGAAYDYIQNDAWNAAQFGFVSQPKVPYLRYNNFGGEISGPILKKKMFFFFNYDQTVNHGSSSNATNSIPTPAVMGGDFSGQFPVYDPTTQTIAYDAKGNPYPVRKSFQEEYGCNCIPTSMFDSVASNFQKFYPTPDNHISGGKFIPGSIGADGELQNNFYSTIPSSNPVRKYFGRLDYDITPSNRLTMSDTQADNPAMYPNGVTECPIGCQGGDIDSNLAQITDVWNINAHTINEARVGYTWAGSFFADLSLGHGYPSALGWKFSQADTIPGIYFYRNYPYAWIQPAQNGVYKQHTFDPSDVVTMIRGKHILHFGGELLIWQDNSTPWNNTNAGDLGFSGQFTEQWTVDLSTGVASANTTTGLEYADFLLGTAQGWSATVQPEFGARLKSPQVFIQDDYKIRPNLTLNLGLRYQINHGWREVRGNEAAFDPEVLNPATQTLGAFWYGSTKAHGRDGLLADAYNVVLPRLGFSYQPRPNMTIRGGFGLYANSWSLDTYGNGMGAAAGGAGSGSDQTNGVTPYTKLDGSGTLYGANTPLPYSQFSTDPARFNNNAVNWTPYHTPVPKIWQWNLSVQQELGTNIVAQLAYVASHGLNLSYQTDLNAIPADRLSSNNLQYRPYPQYQGINGSSNNAISNYNSLQALITKRYSSGLSVSFSYVWSHFLDNQDSSAYGGQGGPVNWQIANNPSASYSNSNFDIRNAFKGYAVYELPFGRNRAFLNKNALVDAVIGGWQVSGTTVLSSGNPFSVFGTQNTYQQAGSAFPNWNSAVSPIPSHRSARCAAGSGSGVGCLNEWYDPAAFLQPANGTFGNVRRNSLYGPGVEVLNLSAGKTFSLPWEGIQLHFRANATNALNHASFSNPSAQTLSGSAGAGQPYSYSATQGGQQITSTTVGGRALQLEGRITF